MAKTTKKHGCLWWALIGWWYAPLDRLTDAKPKQQPQVHPAWQAQQERLGKAPTATRTHTPKTATTKAVTQTGGGTVYVTLHGKKYHFFDDCPALHSGEYYRMDLNRAKATGRYLCNKCMERRYGPEG